MGVFDDDWGPSGPTAAELKEYQEVSDILDGLAIAMWVLACISFLHLAAGVRFMCCGGSLLPSSRRRVQPPEDAAAKAPGAALADGGSAPMDPRVPVVPSERAPPPQPELVKGWCQTVRAHPQKLASFASVVTFTLAGVALWYGPMVPSSWGYSFISSHGEEWVNSIILGCGIPAAVIHGLRLIIGAFCSAETKQLLFAKVRTPDEAADLLEQAERKHAHIVVHYECYHYETHTRTDSKGRTHTERRKVTTASGAVPAAVSWTVDRSSRLDHGTASTFLATDVFARSVVLLHRQILPGNHSSHEALAAHEASVRSANQHRDTHYSQHTSRQVQDAPESITVARSGGGTPCLLHPGSFFIMRLLGLGWLHGLLLRRYVSVDVHSALRKYFFMAGCEPADGVLRSMGGTSVSDTGSSGDGGGAAGGGGGAGGGWGDTKTPLDASSPKGYGAAAETMPYTAPYPVAASAGVGAWGAAGVYPEAMGTGPAPTAPPAPTGAAYPAAAPAFATPNPMTGAAPGPTAPAAPGPTAPGAQASFAL